MYVFFVVDGKQTLIDIENDWVEPKSRGRKPYNRVTRNEPKKSRKKKQKNLETGVEIMETELDPQNPHEAQLYSDSEEMLPSKPSKNSCSFYVPPSDEEVSDTNSYDSKFSGILSVQSNYEDPLSSDSECKNSSSKISLDSTEIDSDFSKNDDEAPTKKRKKPAPKPKSGKKQVKKGRKSKKFACPEPDCSVVYQSARIMDAHVNHAHKNDPLPWKCSFPGCTVAYPWGVISSLSTKMSNHYNTHIPSKAIICKYCSKKFIRKDTLTKHIRLFHALEIGLPFEPFICTYGVCQKRYKTKWQLQIHVLGTHEKKFEFFCDRCGKGFVQRHQLNSHRQDRKSAYCYQGNFTIPFFCKSRYNYARSRAK